MKDEKYTEAGRMLLGFIKSEAKAKGITEQSIADKTGFIQQNVNRMLSGKYMPSLDNFINLAEAVNVYFFLESKDSKTPSAEAMRTRHKRESDSN